MKYKKFIGLFTIAWCVLTSFYALLLLTENSSFEFAIIDSFLTFGTLYLFARIIINILKFYQPGLKNAWYIFVISAVLAKLWLATLFLLSHFVSFEFENYEHFRQASYWLKFSFGYFLLVISSLIMWLIKLIENLNAKKQKEIQTIQIAKDAELNSLKQQLQPHFLFNSLNSISALAGSDPEKARSMIQQLSDFLRVTLKKDHQNFVSFSDELEHLQLYLEIEKVRFGHRLMVNVDVPQSCMNLKVPSLILQPAIENAIKFGLYNTLDVVEIKISSVCTENELKITISNPSEGGTPGNYSNGIGFGLKSMKRRLFLIFNRSDLLFTEKENSLFKTIVIIPQSK